MTAAAAIMLIPLLFPAAIRTAGLSIAYAFGVTIFGGSAQFVFTFIINATGDKLSWVWYIIAMSVVSFWPATMAIRVPRARSHETLEAAAPARACWPDRAGSLFRHSIEGHVRGLADRRPEAVGAGAGRDPARHPSPPRDRLRGESHRPLVADRLRHGGWT